MKIKVTWADGGVSEYTEFNSVDNLIKSIWGQDCAAPDTVTIAAEGEEVVKPKTKKVKE